MNLRDSAEQQIDDAIVQRYFEGAGGGSAATVSMMAHEHNLPASAARYRLHKEMQTISDWLDAVGDSGRVLDVGCGAGAWAEVFAQRYEAIIGIERSPLMVEAAKERVLRLPNVEIFEGDGRTWARSPQKRCHCRTAWHDISEDSADPGCADQERDDIQIEVWICCVYGSAF